MPSYQFHLKLRANIHLQFIFAKTFGILKGLLFAAPSSTENDAASSSDGRADLMAAIRNAGGKDKARLKDGKQRKVERKKEKEKSSAAAASGGDLMSDLFSQLTMRRKGISGKKPEQSGGSSGDVSAMDRISAMIPPPKPRTETTDSTDWE